MRIRSLVPLVAVFVAISLPASAATLTVTNTNDSGPGSLRQAIIDANATAGVADTIAFAIPGAGPHVIEPLSALPAISSLDVVVDGSSQAGATFTSPRIEIRGTNAGVGSSGLSVLSSSGAEIRGLSITGFTTGAGILVNDASGVRIHSNLIGLAPDGTTIRGNLNGVIATTSTVTFNDGALANYVSGNLQDGIRATASTVDIIRNLVGHDADNAGLPGYGNGDDGIDLTNTTANLGQNWSVSNGGYGIRTSGASPVSAHGNVIGIGLGDVPLGNALGGVIIDGIGVDLGGGLFGQNVIAYNGGPGIRVNSGNGNLLHTNSLYDNAGLGIVFGAGNTQVPNDPNDPDVGPNFLQNHPILSNAYFLGGNIHIDYTIDSTPSTTFRLQFYRSDVCDASGFGEGRDFVGFGAVVTDAAGDAAGTFSTAYSQGGGYITATLTNSVLSESSQFSNCLPINNADPVTLRVASTTYGVLEGAAAIVEVERIGSSAGPVSVFYSTSAGTAAANSDYTPTFGVLSWNDGDNSPKAIVVPTVDDALVESPEQFSVVLSGPTGATLAPNDTSVVTINDNDGASVIQMADPDYSVNESGTLVGLVAVRTGNAAGAVSVQFATSSGTATSGVDFTPAMSSVAWADGELGPKPFDIVITSDLVSEGNEDFFVTLSNPTGGATLGAQTVSRVTIVDDDPPALQFAVASVNVNESAGSVEVTVNRVGSSNGAVSVQYGTVSGSATAGADFTAAAGTLNWADGDAAPKVIIIPITNDALTEAAEQFTVTLQNPGNAVLGSPATVTVTINDDDAVPVPTTSEWGLILLAAALGLGAMRFLRS